MNASWRAGNNPLASVCYDKCVFYTEAEMAELIAYGAGRAPHPQHGRDAGCQ